MMLPIIFKALYAYIGEMCHLDLVDAINKFKSENRSAPYCWLCGKHIRYKEVTVDHVIPKKILKLYDFPELIYDPRNFALAHKLCNVQRGDMTPDDLPPKIKEALDKLKTKE